jgi:hypothetical protein
MTVIAHVYTSEGFVVGADGRGRTEAGCVLRDDLRKLIRLNGPGANLICGWTGATRIRARNETFDLSEQTETIGGLLSSEHLGTQYVERFSRALRDRFTAGIQNVFRTKDAKGLFVGYLKDDHKSYWEPKYWDWDLKSEDEPTERWTNQGRYKITSGLEDVLHRLRLSEPETLMEGTNGLYRYIESCIENCGEYGGRIQIEIIPRPV